MENIITAKDITRDLKKLGFNKGDSVYIHVSLKKIGWLKDGAKTLTEAFYNVLGDEGTLVVPTHTGCLEFSDNPPYDPYSTPTKLGAFPEAVRRYTGAKRSAHGTHSSAAIGKNAEFYTSNHDLKNPMSINSPIYKLSKNKGKTLLIGVDNRSNTALHLAESLAKMPYVKLPYCKKSGLRTKAYNNEGEIFMTTQEEFPGCSDGFEIMEDKFKKSGIVTYGKVGNADSRLYITEKMIDITILELKKNPFLLLCNDKNCPCCPDRYKLLNDNKK